MVEVKHPDEQMLLAYVQQQSYENWPGGISQHIAHCKQCRARCAEYTQAGKLLETWAHSRSFQGYPSITERVLQQIGQPQVAQLQHSVQATKRSERRLTSVPLAVALLLLFCVVVIALAYHYVPLPVGAGSNHVVPTATVVVPQITPPPYPSGTLPPGKKASPVVTPTPSLMQGSKPSIRRLSLWEVKRASTQQKH